MTRQRTSSITDQHNRRAWLKAAFPRLFGFDARFGLRDDRMIMERLNAAFGDARIEAMSTPLPLPRPTPRTAVRRCSSGCVIDAIRASIAVPFVQSLADRRSPLYRRLHVGSAPGRRGDAEGAEVIVAMVSIAPIRSRSRMRVGSPSR